MRLSQSEKLLKKAVARSKQKPSDRVAIVSYDEEPGIQAIATTSPDLPPEPGVHPTFARDHEYKRHGTVSLLAGIDLVTGKVHALVKERHRSREFIEFLKLLDQSYAADTAIHLILDNHSAHISKETKAWLAEQPAVRGSDLARPTWLARHVLLSHKKNRTNPLGCLSGGRRKNADQCRTVCRTAIRPVDK